MRVTDYFNITNIQKDREDSIDYKLITNAFLIPDLNQSFQSPKAAPQEALRASRLYPQEDVGLLKPDIPRTQPCMPTLEHD